MSVYEKIRQLVLKKKISYNELSLNLNMTKSNLAQYENLKYDLPPKYAVRFINLAENYGVFISFEDFYDDSKIIKVEGYK